MNWKNTVMEIIVSLIFFLAISALCLPVFGKAVWYREKSSELDHAVIACSSAMDVILSGGEGVILPYCAEKDGIYYLILDDGMQMPGKGAYEMTIGLGSEIKVSIKKGTEVIFSLCSQRN